MLRGIFEQLAEAHQLPKKLALDLLAGMVERVTQASEAREQHPDRWPWDT